MQSKWNRDPLSNIIKSIRLCCLLLMLAMSQNVDTVVFTWTHNQCKSDVFKEHCAYPEEDVGQADQHEQDKPDPDDEVHLLVDDVLWEDAQAVVVLFTSASPNVGHSAADVSWESPTEWVDVLPLLDKWHLRVQEHVPTVGSEIQTY